MKILFAIKTMDNAAGGAERVLAIVASGLAARGHEVALLSFDADGGQSFFTLDPTIRRIRLGLGDVGTASGAIETLRRLPALRRATLDFDPDVAVGFMHSMFVPLAFALGGTGIPVVASEHIVPAHYRDRPLQYALLLASVPLVKAVTVTLRSVAKLYPRFVQRKIVVLPNPVARLDLLDLPRRDLILNVGRLDPQKDQATLIDAFAIVASVYPSWTLRIAGDGPLRGELKRQVERSGLADRVEFAGNVADIAAEYAQARVFALSSRYESFGLATAEAMAAGLPVVGFADCPGTNDLIRSGLNGLLAHGQDRATSLARVLEALIVDADLRQRLGEAGRATASTFAPGAIVKDWEVLLAAMETEEPMMMDDMNKTPGEASCCAMPPRETGGTLKTYRPLIVLALIAVAMGVALDAGTVLGFTPTTMGSFLVLLATVKLFDLKGFAATFARYDIVGRHSRAYALGYPFLELTLGLFYLSGTLPVLTSLVTFVVMGLNFASAWMARGTKDLACACLGSGFALPLGRVTLIEYGVMAVMALEMLLGG